MRELHIDLEPIRKRKLFIGVPAYGGNVNLTFYMQSLALQQALLQHGISHMFWGIGNESLISRGRNRIVAEFLASDCTDLLFIDADIEFQPLDVIALMHFNKPVIGGSYPLKRISWSNVKEAVLANPAIPVDDLPTVAAPWSAHLDKPVAFEPFVPVPVRNLATGFMMISRETFERVAPSRPTYPDQRNNLVITDFFPVGVFEGTYESEDYSFCRLVREAGLSVWLCPWMKLNHQGTHSYIGNMHLGLQYLEPVQNKELN